jgi:hypothetical protein
VPRWRSNVVNSVRDSAAVADTRIPSIGGALLTSGHVAPGSVRLSERYAVAESEVFGHGLAIRETELPHRGREDN